LSGLCAECNADTDLSSSTRENITDYAVDPYEAEQQSSDPSGRRS
jgi:hypothetical protein